MSSLSNDDRLARLLGGERLAGLRQRLRLRFERTRAPEDRVHFRIDGLDHDEYAALAGLMGKRPRFTGSLLVDVGLIDAAFQHAGIAASLRQALERLDGPIQHRTTELVRLRAAWSEVAVGCRHPVLRHLLQAPVGLGLIKRLAGGDPDVALRLCRQADIVLQQLPVAGVPRAQLAARLFGDAHALDDGRPAATIVLAAWRRSLADKTDNIGIEDMSPIAQSEERARDVWAACGVLVNELARPALLLNLPTQPGEAFVAQAGEPAFASLRLLLRSAPKWDVSGRTVHVCENPNFVAIAAGELGPRCAPLVCTDGMPAAAQRHLLTQLAAAGARLLVHADFDWPGLWIARSVMQICAAAPWRFGSVDYEAAIRASPVPGGGLIGSAVEAAWDPDLTQAMLLHRQTIAEEAVADMLLADLEQAI